MPTSLLKTSVVPLGLVAAPEIGGAPPGKTLTFALEPQRQDQWCWAAVTASVATFYRNRGWSQCRVVNDRFGQTECCANGSSSACNRPWYLDKALSRVGNLGGFTKGPLTAQEVRAEIDSGRPIAVRIGWINGGGHFVTVSGYSFQDILDIQDPWFGRSTVSYLAFKSRYRGTGRWTHAYRTIPRGSPSASPTF